MSATDRARGALYGLAIGDAEDLCASKIEALRSNAPPMPLAGAGPTPAAPNKKKHGGRQLVFRFE